MGWCRSFSQARDGLTDILAEGLARSPATVIDVLMGLMVMNRPGVAAFGLCATLISLALFARMVETPHETHAVQ